MTSHLGPWEVTLLLTLADQPCPELEERLLSQPYVLKGQPQRLEVSMEVRKASRPLRTGEEPVSPRKAERRRQEEERAFVRSREGQAGAWRLGLGVSYKEHAEKFSCTP